MKSEQEYERLSQLPTPFYFYDMELLEQTLQTVTQQAARYNFQLHYAVKANNEPRILETIRNYGLGADCVSGNEVRASIEAGFAPEKVVYAGVGKSDEEILYGIRAGIFSFNCESRQELEVINELAASEGKVVNVALRINPDIDPKTHRYISTGKSDNKFGIYYNEINEVIDSLESLKHIRIVGLHFHVGSQITDMDVFKNLSLRVNQLQHWFDEKGLRLEHINLGGGLGIDYADPQQGAVPDFARYFSVIDEHLQRREGQTVHFELGRSIVGQCGELITRALFTKISGDGSRFVITDAGMNDLMRPALYQASHRIVNLTAGARKRQQEWIYTIGGPICESSDIFARSIPFPETHRGDLLSIQSAGAYGKSMASCYNMRRVAPSVYSDQL